MKQDDKKKKKQKVVKTFFKLAPVILGAAPVAFLGNSILSIAHGVSWGVVVAAQQYFFDIAVTFAAGEAQLQGALAALALLGLTQAVTQALNGIANYVPQIIVSKVGGQNALRIFRKLGRLAPIVFEDTEKLDDINKAEQGRENALWFVFTIMMIFTFYVPYFAFMGWYLFRLKPILAVAIILVFVPTAITQVLRVRIFSKLEDKSAPERREYEYYESCMVSREYFKETRLLGGFHFFKDRYLETLKLLQSMSWKANVKSNLMELGMRVITALGYIGILFLLFDALMKQEITVGAFAAVFNSIGALYAIMEEVVCRHIGGIAQNLGTIQNYMNFLELEERGGEDGELPDHYDVVMRDVVFNYPGAEEAAVKGVNLTLHDGETLAVVGENGSGKSTLIRLLTGLYVPQAGTVCFGEKDTSELSMECLFSGISAVFQKYQRYQMTLSENIRISGSKEQSESVTLLDEACKMAGVSKEDTDFPQGYDTMLSREFDGVDLSGGEWQRVAIARGFYRNHRMILLDEPTAAIDPYEETRIYNRFAEISKNKTAVIVTHRLGSVKLADRIAVMKNGQIAEIGTHEELIAAEGEYARLYQAQEQWYRED